MELNENVLKLICAGKKLENADFFTGYDKLSKTEFRLLQEIIVAGKNGKNIISSHLAKKLGITRSAVSQIVTKLERENIVRRVASPTDRKIAYVQLSDYSRELYEAQCARANALMERIIAEFGEEEFSNFIGNAERLAGIIAAAGKEWQEETKS